MPKHLDPKKLDQLARSVHGIEYQNLSPIDQDALRSSMEANLKLGKGSRFIEEERLEAASLGTYGLAYGQLGADDQKALRTAIRKNDELARG